MKPIIAVTMSLSDETPFAALKTCRAYPDAITKAGGIPLLCAYENIRDYALLADGLLLSGGDDVDPVLYGENSYHDTVKFTPTRDAFEFNLCSTFLELEKPILAICRGHQVLNVVLGGSLIQDLPSQQGVFHSDVRHVVHAEKGSIIERLYGAQLETNSYHHQAIKRLGNNLVITAHAADGTVEAVESPNGKIFSYQWHPERMISPNQGNYPDMLPLFTHFISICNKS